MKTLIAEDESVSRLRLQRAVETLGHDCLITTDGLEAWKLFQASPVEVIISNWMMPGLDGPEFCSRVRARGGEHYTYFILLSSLDDKQHFVEAMQAGVDDYLTKPLDQEELQATLMAAARVTSLHRELAEKNSELERLNRALFESARIDPLTGLGNRLRLLEDLESLQGRVERYGHNYCVALFDVDCFKAYNDRFGHLAGDDVLRAVARTVSDHRRSGDTAYRFGGEEFLVILPEQTLQSATTTVERIRQAIQDLGIPHPANAAGAGVVTISAGIATLSPGSRLTYDALLTNADIALYQAKEAGRNRVAVHADRVLQDLTAS